MDDAERERRRQEIGEEVRRRQTAAGHEGPLPAFLDVLTDFMIDTEAELDRIHRYVNLSDNWGRRG